MTSSKFERVGTAYREGFGCLGRCLLETIRLEERSRRGEWAYCAGGVRYVGDGVIVLSVFLPRTSGPRIRPCSTPVNVLGPRLCLGEGSRHFVRTASRKEMLQSTILSDSTFLVVF